MIFLNILMKAAQCMKSRQVMSIRISKKPQDKISPLRISALGQERFWPLSSLKEYLKYDSQAEAKKHVVSAIESVSKQLGNTPSICRKCYIHPEIVNAYMSGDLAKMTEGRIEAAFRSNTKHLSSEEVMVLAFLLKRLRANRHTT